MPEHHTRPLVDAGAVADRYGVSRATVHGWRRRGEIPYVQAAGTIRFDLEEVEQALRRRTNEERTDGAS